MMPLECFQGAITDTGVDGKVIGDALQHVVETTKRAGTYNCTLLRDRTSSSWIESWVESASPRN